MSGERESTEEWLRQRLRHAVDEVEPAADALPRVLSRVRRRHRGRRVPAVSLAAAFAVACGIVVLALVGVPGVPGAPGQFNSPDTQPVSVGPDSYVTAATSGRLAAFDLASGRPNGALTHFDQSRPRAVAGAGQRVYVLLSGETDDAARRVVAVGADGGRRTVTELPHTADTSVLAADADRVAYVDRRPSQESLVVTDGSTPRRLTVPDGTDVRDVALAPDGRLAVLLGASGDDEHAQVRVLEPGADTLDAEPLTGLAAMPCGPVAVSWSEGRVAALQPVTCGATTFRVTTVDGSDGRVSGAGVPFHADVRGPRAPRLSADRLGRFLVSTGQDQWLVDDASARPLPKPRTDGRGVPATLWG